MFTARRAEEERDSRIRDLRTLARRERGKEPVVSMIVARGFVRWVAENDGDGRRESSTDARRWSEIYVVVLALYRDGH